MGPLLGRTKARFEAPIYRPPAARHSEAVCRASCKELDRYRQQGAKVMECNSEKTHCKARPLLSAQRTEAQ